ncbi:MAG TPA: hypothetical protein VGB83_07270 [Actinomycetota bacterium]
MDPVVPGVFLLLPPWCLDDGTPDGPFAYNEDPPPFDPGPQFVEQMASRIDCGADGKFHMISDSSNTQMIAAAYLECSGGFSDTYLLAKIQENTGSGWSDRDSADDPRSPKNPKTAVASSTCGRTALASYRAKFRVKVWDHNGNLVGDHSWKVGPWRGRCK